jgi:trigger factor
MQVSVEKISATECRLTIVIAIDQIDKAHAKQMQAYAKTAKIKGFRPGKVPLSYVKRQFGDALRREAIDEVVEATLKKAMHDEKLVPVSTPKVEAKTAITEGGPLEFVASFEVLPEIGDVQFSIDTVEKWNVEVQQEDIDYVIGQLLKQYTKWHVVERPAALHDRAVINYHIVFDGKPDMERAIANFPLELGSNAMLPGFEEGLIGAVAGEERTLHLHFPADYPVVERAGKAADFVVHVGQIFEAEKPILDSHFIQTLGIKSGQEQDFVQQIRHTLEHERNRLVKEKLKEQVFRVLLEQNPIEVPHSMIEREAMRVHHEIHPPHPDGRKHAFAEHSADEIAAFKDIARQRVTLSLLLGAYAKQNSMKPDHARIEARIAEIASAYEEPQEVVEWLSSEKNRHDIEFQVLEDQAIDKLIESVPTKEKTMSYAELKGLPRAS